MLMVLAMLLTMVSPSPRRAWIEILRTGGTPGGAGVALPTEGVDRNYGRTSREVDEKIVALPTEGVDRNVVAQPVQLLNLGRPPHGGRG